MNMKYIIFMVVVLLVVCIPVNATITDHYQTKSCTPGGEVSSTVDHGSEWICYAKTATSHKMSYSGAAHVYYTIGGATISYYHSSDGCGAQSNPCGKGGACGSYWEGCMHGSAKINGSVTLWAWVCGGSYMGSCASPTASIKAYYGEDFYTISGKACGNGLIRLTDGTNILSEWNTTANNNYMFDIMNNTYYELDFIDYTYEFTCTDNIIKDNDLCDWQILHYVDDCGNFLKNPTINIIKNDNYANPLIDDGSSHTDVFRVGEDIEVNDKLDIWIGTDQGEQFRTIYARIGEDYLYHAFKSWDLDITVYDINTTAYISGAKVSVKQDCRINEYPLNTFGTTNMYGYIKTYDLSNQAYQVKVEKNNYTTFGYQTINAGFDAQHTNIPLTVYLQDPTKGSGNGTIGEPPSGGDGTGGDDEESLPQTPCSIMWADNDGKSITEINDTQDARLYFMAPNCSATLYLESRDSDNHVWVFEASLPVTALQTGYAQYISTDWTYPETKRYRGRLWGDDCMCDATDDLKVWNASDANITIVNNLTANVHFRHKVGGTYINPVTPIHISSTAASNNTSLLNINLQLFNSTVKVDEISYTFFDYYTDGSFSSIQWHPNYKYSAGHLYCIYMYSNNILVNFDSVYANATDDNYFDTGNTLTIKVYDQNSMPLTYSSVYIEGWGTEDTGNSNQVTFSGVGNDDYQYRAIKSGYLDRGYYTVSLSGDETVFYILDEITTEHAITDVRMNDKDMKALLFPIFFFIMILLLLGLLIDAAT